MRRLFCWSTCFGLLVIFTSCATVPQQAVQLSEELTGMIRASEKSHLAMLDQYIAERRQRTNDFLDKIWIPKFLDNYMHDSGILDSITVEQNKNKKDTLFFEFTNTGTKIIKKRRDTLLDAISTIEKSLRDSIIAHYDNMLVINQALTAHLRSAAEVTETRENLLSKLNIDTKQVLPFEDLNAVFEKVQSYEGEIENIRSIIDEAKSLLKRR